MRFPWTRTVLALVFVACLWALRLRPPGLVKVDRSAMGTMWSIAAPDRGRPEDARAAIAKAYREIARIEDVMSEWRPESPISKVDAVAGHHAVEVPRELREILERSIRYSEITEGTFDVTWRGMGRIWHFDDTFAVPSRAAVEEARKHIDYRKIRIEGDRVYLPEGVNIGLGGIAKGYAVDRAAMVLKDAGFPDSLVDGGGDVLASGTRNGEPWRLGIQDPRREHGEILGVVPVSGMALVTSGDYERYRIVDGVRFHHIIDPRTGWPAGASISVTVLSRTAEQGVVLAKGIFILGPEKGLDLARREGVEALLIDAAQKRFVTAGFPLLR